MHCYLLFKISDCDDDKDTEYDDLMMMMSQWLLNQNCFSSVIDDLRDHRKARMFVNKIFLFIRYKMT